MDNDNLSYDVDYSTQSQKHKQYNVLFPRIFCENS